MILSKVHLTWLYFTFMLRPLAFEFITYFKALGVLLSTVG